MIPDEAVEAAARALDPRTMGSAVLLSEKFKDEARAEARRALEAAAPHLFAPLLALADERDETHGAIRGHITTYELRQAIDPYRSHS